MSKPCPFEDSTAAAARGGDWSAELAAHRDGCLSCAELTLVVAALAAEAESLAADARPLPDPRILWLRAALAAREAKLARATRAIAWVQRAALAAAAAVGLFAVPEVWGLVKPALAALDLASPIAGLPRAAGSPVLALGVSLAILGALALYELTAVREG
jgi:hypothetical protein